MIAAREYDGSIAALCAEIETQTHAASVAQELILKRAFEGLSAEQAETIGVLSLSDVAIARDDAIALIETALVLVSARPWLGCAHFLNPECSSCSGTMA